MTHTGKSRPSWPPGLTDSVVLVTGGWRGIGRACVEAFQELGARVAFTYVEGKGAADEVAAILERAPASLSAHNLDLRDAHSIRTCVKAAAERWGGLDILINNAAVGSATVASFASDEDAQDAAMLEINAWGTLLMCRAFLAAEALAKRPRKIINMSSVGGGISQFPGFRLSDGMSKAAVAHLTRQLAAEHVHADVDIFAICPGATNTAMFQASTLNAMSETERTAFLARLPKGRLIEPEEIASIATFLASDCSTPLHGAVIDASMGLGVRPGLITEHAH